MEVRVLTNWICVLQFDFQFLSCISYTESYIDWVKNDNDPLTPSTLGRFTALSSPDETSLTLL